MKLKMKAIDLVTILSEVSRAKKADVYDKYGLDTTVKRAIQHACRRGKWKLV